MTGKPSGDDPLRGVELSRRELIQRIVVGTAFALPVVASFDMASLGVSSAYANNPNQNPPSPSFTSADATTFTVGQYGNFQIITPGAAPVTVTESGELPYPVALEPNPGNTYNYNSNNDANLVGTPSAGTGGVYDITLTASNNFPPAATQFFTLTVNESPAFTSPSAATLSTTHDSTVEVTTSGYPHATVSMSGTLPPGMTFTPDPSTGRAAISGRPGAAGVYTVSLTANNGVGSPATQTLRLTVDEPAMFTTGHTATFYTSRSSRFVIRTAAKPPATITLSGALPAGMAFAADPATGTAVLSGKPRASAIGKHHLTLTASNGESPNATQAFVLTVEGPLTVSHVETTRSPEVIVDAHVAGPGTITAVVTVAPSALAASAARKTKPKRVTVASTKVRVRRSRTIKLKTRPNLAGRRFAHSAHRHAEMWLTVTFRPTHGRAASHTVKHLHLK